MLHLHDDYTTARQVFERALAIDEKVLGPNNPIPRRASATSPSCSRPTETVRNRKRSSSGRYRFAYRFGGKQKLLAIGSYPATSLADARLTRDEAKRLLELVDRFSEIRDKARES
jgi:hypothetical protein